MRDKDGEIYRLRVDERYKSRSGGGKKMKEKIMKELCAEWGERRCYKSITMCHPYVWINNMLHI